MSAHVRIAVVSIAAILASLAPAWADLSVTYLRHQCEVTQVTNKSFYVDTTHGQNGICCTDPEKSEGWCCFEKASETYGRCTRQSEQDLSAVQ